MNDRPRIKSTMTFTEISELKDWCDKTEGVLEVISSGLEACAKEEEEAQQQIKELKEFKEAVVKMQKDNYGNGSMTHILLNQICNKH